MICPQCGFVDEKILIPKLTRKTKILGHCKNCGSEVISQPTTRTFEKSKHYTVQQGEAREDILARIYLEFEEGSYYKKRESTDDIDLEIYSENNILIYFLEIKERSNSINAYRETKFPYMKIKTAKDLMRKHKKPVFVLLKFSDCWSRISIQLNKKYKKGQETFFPNYRPEQKGSKYQIPVLIPVESLEILTWGKFVFN